MWRSFVSLWKNIFDYKGVACRKEFWLGSVANIIAMYVGLIPAVTIIKLIEITGLVKVVSPGVFAAVYICIFMVPLFSLYVRRANDVGMKKYDTLLAAVAVPVVGAMVIGACPPEHNVPDKRLSWCYRALAVGIGMYLYGGFIGAGFYGSVEAMGSVIIAGLLLAVCSAVVGAVIVMKNSNTAGDTPSEKYVIIYSYGYKVPGNLHEEVRIVADNGQYYFQTLSEYDRMNAGGVREKVPEEYIVNGCVVVEELLKYIAKNHPYMESMEAYRK